MTNKTKTSIVFVGIGAVLIMLALLLFLFNEVRNVIMEAESFDIYTELQKSIEQMQRNNSSTSETISNADSMHDRNEIGGDEIIDVTTDLEAEVNSLQSEVKTITVGGYDYIGTMEIPTLGLSLPIMSDWDYEKLDIAPCRQFGSIQTDDLVIAGHNYRRHFKYLYKLEAGDSLYLTNAAGTVIEYVVAKNRTLKATEVDTVQNSEYDMVLYTCTYTGTERVVVFCERKDNSNGVEN